MTEIKEKELKEKETFMESSIKIDELKKALKELALNNANEILKVHEENQKLKQQLQNQRKRIEEKIKFWSKPYPERLKIQPEFLEKIPTKNLEEFCINFLKEELKSLLEVEPIILDNNPLSIACYAEEFPENWKKIENSKKDREEVR